MDLEDFKTSDMGLVAFLKYRGIEAGSVVWQSGTCHWYYPSQGNVMTAAEEYNSGLAAVEPKGYNFYYGATKREFFDANPNDRRKGVR